MNLIHSIHSFFQGFFFLIDCHVLRNEKKKREREVNIEVDNDRGIHKSVAILNTRNWVICWFRSIDSWKFEDQPSLLKKIGSNQIFKIRLNTLKNSLYKLTRNVTIVMFQNSTAKFQRNDLMIYYIMHKMN